LGHVSERAEVALTARGILRALPLLGEDGLRQAKDQIGGDFILCLLRSLNAILIFCNNPEDTSLLRIIGEHKSEIDRRRDSILFLPSIWRDCTALLKHALLVCKDPKSHAQNELASLSYKAFGQGSMHDFSSTRQSRAALILALRADTTLINSSVSATALFEMPLWPLDIQPHPISTSKAGLVAFQTVHPSFAVWDDWYQARVEGGVSIFKERLIALLPPEVASLGYVGANARIAEILSGRARQPLNRVRAIFLGHGEAGKTSLIRSIHGDPVIGGDQEMTRGLQISTSSAREHGSAVSVTETRSKDDLTIHYWDFGGQVMVHHTHQFFLRSNCLYVVVIDGRRNERATEDARYWLEHVRAYADDAPVMIVGNKVDLSPVQLDLFSLKQIFPNIVDYYPVSCTEASGKYKIEFDRFYRDFFLLLQGPVLTRQALLTEAEFSVLTAIQDNAKRNPFVNISRFLAICRKNGTTDDGESERQLINLFDKLGIVIHFPTIPLLGDLLLNPEWLTRAVYEIMYSPELRDSGGIITPSDVFDILNSSEFVDNFGRTLKYDARQSRFIIDVMKQFQLAYSVEGRAERIVVPALLQAQQPTNDFDRADAFGFRIRFEGFMPTHILPTIIVDRSAEIHNDEVWRFGVRLKSRLSDVEAMVQADEHARTITVWMKGEEVAEYLGVLRDRIHHSLSRIGHIRYYEEIFLPSGAALERNSSVDSWENYRQIRAALRNYARLPTDTKPSRIPFVATNEREYDLGLVRSGLPELDGSIRILYLAANPIDSTSLDIEEEIRALQVELRGSRYRQKISFAPRHAVRPDDLVRYVRDEKPNIVHFSGHGNAEGIALRKDNGEVAMVSGSALRTFLHQRGVRLVVLSSCYSSAQADEISEVVDAVIGTSAAIEDGAAKKFAVAFYRSLGDGLSVSGALRDGRDAVILNGTDDVFCAIGNLNFAFVED
jgi:GTPase SAR1 family protein